MTKTRLIIITLFLFTLYSCKKEEFKAETSVSNRTTKSDAIDGEKLNNPYTIVNMRLAFSNLKSKLGIQSAIKLNASHLYIKFMPSNDSIYGILKADSNLILYSYPLDYKMKEATGNDHYSYSADSNSFYYSSVKIGYSLPKVDYLILDSLYIPEEDNNYNLPFDKYDLETEAFVITGNLDPNEGRSKASSWTPAGTITLWDDNFASYLALEGVKVKARRWFTTHTGITNATGYYQCNGSFNGPANYSLEWERYDFEVRDSWLGTAGINGPKKTGNWDLNLKDGTDEFHATIFKGAYHYYYKDIKNLRRPPQNSFWATQLKYRAMNESSSINGSHCPSCRFLGLGSAIKIYNPQHESQAIYGTTIHETAHASHWNMDSWHYNHCDDVVAESWARGVQWELTRMIYTGYQPSYFDPYTGVVQDMIDGIGGYDQVEGYTIRQLEDALMGERYWQNWRTDIQNTYTNATENNLESLFTYWHP